MMQFKLEQFSGPLDLLLGLIGEKKLEINKLAISEVTEQYVRYIEHIEEKDPDELADFLVVATKLLLLKSKTLLPQFFPEEEEGPGLEEQLRLYKAFVDVSKKLNKTWLETARTFFRIEPTRRPETFLPPENLTQDKLHDSMVQLVHRLTPLEPLPQIQIDKTVSVKAKISYIRDLLAKLKSISFDEILGKSKNKSDVIVGFLALLELVKQQEVVLRQKNAFDDISVSNA